MFKSMACSRSLEAPHPQEHAVPHAPELTNDQYAQSSIYTQEEHYQLARQDFSAATRLYSNDSPQEPRKPHPQSLISFSHFTHDFPPLITPTSTEWLKLQSPSASDDHHLHTYETSPDQSRQIPPTQRTARTSSSSRGDKADEQKAESKPGKLAKWFEGESEPIKLGLIPSPNKEKADPFNSTALSLKHRSSTSLKTKSTSQITPKPTMATRFSFFSSESSLANKPAPTADMDDELFHHEVRAALKPLYSKELHVSSNLRDLQQQAEAIINRLQVAYRERALALKEATAEKETLFEEAQSAETRSMHLKLQLDETTKKFEEQDEAMMNLVDELAQVKLAKREAEEALKSSVMLMEQNTPPASTHRIGSIVSAVGFDSEDESLAESVFSRHFNAHSPTMSATSASTLGSPDGSHFADVQRLVPMPSAARLRIPASQGFTKGISAMTPHRQRRSANCEDVRAAEAWSVVSKLEKENKGLKQRLKDLEGVLDECLDDVRTLARLTKMPW
ncbi:MAG: hypothetical protein Q9164_003626 [Protoblastenia rupestris]